MKTRLHENGWTVMVDGNVNDLTKEEIHEVARLVATKMVVVFPEQIEIEPQQELAFAETIGSVHMFVNQAEEKDKERAKTLMHKGVDGIIRVTGKLINGEPGLFGHNSELDWHSNQASKKTRKAIVWMYGDEGMEGSRTSFLSMVEAYEKMPSELKEKIADKKCYFGFKPGRYSTTPFFKGHVNKENLFDLVMPTTAGVTGLYYPFHQVFGMDGLEEEEFQELHQEIVDWCLQEQFMYHHDWVDGQIILSDQWLSLHKRWAFDKMEERLLHRIAFDYDNVYESYPYPAVA